MFIYLSLNMLSLAIVIVETLIWDQSPKFVSENKRVFPNVQTKTLTFVETGQTPSAMRVFLLHLMAL